MVAIFDMDGVIVNSMPILEDMAVDIMTTLYGTTVDKARELYRSTVGKAFRDQLEECFPTHRFNHYAALAYSDFHAVKAPEFPLATDAIRVTQLLRALGHKPVLVSSTSRKIVKDMAQIYSLPWELIFGKEDGKTKKDQVREVLLTFPEQKVCFFGDTEHDREIASNFGSVDFYLTTCDTLLENVSNAIAATRS